MSKVVKFIETRGGVVVTLGWVVVVEGEIVA